MLVKSTLGVNFTNLLHAAFMLIDPKSAKNTVKPSVIFALLGSARIKAERKHVCEIDTWSLLPIN